MSVSFTALSVDLTVKQRSFCPWRAAAVPKSTREEVRVRERERECERVTFFSFSFLFDVLLLFSLPLTLLFFILSRSLFLPLTLFSLSIVSLSLLLSLALLKTPYSVSQPPFQWTWYLRLWYLCVWYTSRAWSRWLAGSLSRWDRWLPPERDVAVLSNMRMRRKRQEERGER